MILGLGLDLVEIDRIQRIFDKFGPSFTRKILRPEEYLDIGAGEAPLPLAARKQIQHLASRFAAKEAAVKALGTGFSNGISLHDITVVNDARGKPELAFHGKAGKIFTDMGGTHALLTITHTNTNAAAVVIIEKRAG